jgi:serine/threonine-protein kinase
MTPERWRQIDDLFDAAIRLPHADRESWLRLAGVDDELRAEVGRLLAQDDRAQRDGFLAPPEGTGRPLRERRHPQDPTEAPGRVEAATPDETGVFSPKAAIAAGSRPQPISETPSVMRARLRELPIIYLLILGMILVWTHAVRGNDDLTISTLRSTYTHDAIVIAALVAMIAVLSGRWHVSLAWLRALELGMVGVLAGLFAAHQYKFMLAYSISEDFMMAQLTFKNAVLLTCILILTYGLFVPKSWRRAAVVAWPLAMLPFATLAALCLRHPEAMGWLRRGWMKSQMPRLWLYTFDGMILIILAAGSAFGARTISRLRRQVAEARQLGQYRLRRLIGAGGMGEVYLAEHQFLKRPCALKLIRPDSVADPRALQRFEREVQLTARLSHPNTVEIFDYGRTEDGAYYYVMEYLPGLSLAELVEGYGPLPPARAVYLLRQTCQALGEAHATGLIHRDIKPSNIFAARRGGMDDVAKLLDFGLVRPSSTAFAPQLSEEGQILGTPLFMSPEQATGARELDGRSDIYSLGAVAYYLLTGRPPFDEGSGIGVMIAHARDPVVPPSQVRPGIPQDLERVVLRCLAKDAAGRFPDAASLERALGECACVGDWDRGRAARWWDDRGSSP